MMDRATWSIPTMGMAAAAGLLVAIPLHAHVAVWAWALMLAAAVMAWWAQREGRRTNKEADQEADQEAQEIHRALRAWAGMALVACVIDGAMGLWHGEGLRTMRQDGKLLLAALFTAVLWSAMQSRAAASAPPRPGLRPGVEALWPLALTLQMAVAAAVALSWPRADLPPSPLPWAMSVALGLAVLAPLVLRNPLTDTWGAGLHRRAGPTGLQGLVMAAVVCGVVAVLWSRSRSAWVVLPWLMVVLVACSQRKARAFAAALAVAALGLAAMLHHDAQQPVQVERGLRLLDLWDELQRLGQPDPSSSTGSRVLLWQAAWHSLVEHPWTGIGMSARIALVQEVVPPHRMMDIEPLVHVHQQFLNQAVDHGLPGLLASMLSAGGLLLLALKVPRGTLQWQLAGVAVVHGAGLLFNANMTHGPYAFATALAVTAAVMMHAAPAASAAPRGQEPQKSDPAEHR